MAIYDIDGNLLQECDLEAGWLRDEIRIVHHDAVAAVPESGHYEDVCVYPNGGKDVKWVVDIPGVDGCDAWDEDIHYQVYVPYTDDELAARKKEQIGRSVEQRITELEDAMLELAALIAGGDV